MGNKNNRRLTNDNITLNEMDSLIKIFINNKDFQSIQHVIDTQPISSFRGINFKSINFLKLSFELINELNKKEERRLFNMSIFHPIFFPSETKNGYSSPIHNLSRFGDISTIYPSVNDIENLNISSDSLSEIFNQDYTLKQNVLSDKKDKKTPEKDDKNYKKIRPEKKNRFSSQPLNIEYISKKNEMKDTKNKKSQKTVYCPNLIIIQNNNFYIKKDNNITPKNKERIPTQSTLKVINKTSKPSTKECNSFIVPKGKAPLKKSNNN